MFKKTLAPFFIIALSLFSACAEETASALQPAVSTVQPATSPTPVIMELLDDPFVPFYIADLSDVIESSDTIVIGCVKDTLPAERKDNEVYTPANIKAIQSLKGDYKSGDVFTINQLGGVAGGIDFRPHTMFFHEDGETYLFFIDSAYGNVMHSEHAAGGQTLEGYFFNGKTTDEAVSIINECIKNGKFEFNIDQIESICFVQMADNMFLMYSVDKTGLEAQITHDMNNYLPFKTEKWDITKWGPFISDLQKCGVFNWEDKNYGDPSYTGGSWWNVEFGCIGYIGYGGTNAYPDGWDSFMKIIERYMGKSE